MKLNELFAISPEKVDALKMRILQLGINLELIEEQFIRGGGKGGQKRNKTSNVVRLFYPPLELAVRCGRDRQRNVNRFLALRELVDQIEMKISPETSAKLKEWEGIRRNKKRQKRKSQNV